jgi:hypothetical protein
MIPFALCRHLFVVMGHLIGQIESWPTHLRLTVYGAATETSSAARTGRKS